MQWTSKSLRQIWTIIDNIFLATCSLMTDYFVVTKILFLCDWVTLTQSNLESDICAQNVLAIISQFNFVCPALHFRSSASERWRSCVLNNFNCYQTNGLRVSLQAKKWLHLKMRVMVSQKTLMKLTPHGEHRHRPTGSTKKERR